MERRKRFKKERMKIGKKIDDVVKEKYNNERRQEGKNQGEKVRKEPRREENKKIRKSNY